MLTRGQPRFRLKSQQKAQQKTQQNAQERTDVTWSPSANSLSGSPSPWVTIRKTQSEPQLASERATHLETQLTTAPGTQLKTQLTTDSEFRREMQVTTEPATQIETQQASEPETQPKTQTEAVIQAETRQASEPETQTKTQTEAVIQAETQQASEPKTQTETQTEAVIQAETQLTPEAATQPEVQQGEQGNSPMVDSQWSTVAPPTSSQELDLQSKSDSHSAASSSQLEQRQHQLDDCLTDQLDHCLAEQGIILPPSILDHRQLAGQSSKEPLLDWQGPSTSSRRPEILDLPYPVELTGADLQRAFPGQIGQFFVTNAGNYAYSCNWMSIEMAAESMGFERMNFVEMVRPIVSRANGSTVMTADQRIEELENELERDPRLTLMILKPAQMKWSKLGNCLLFEGSHPQWHQIADKWQMVLVLRRSAELRHLQLTTASGRKFDYNHFILYTANPGMQQKELLQHLDANPGTYILKRTNYSQGIGIRIYRAQAPNSIEEIRLSVGHKVGLNSFIMQKYIERPLLVDKRKFDLRVYMLLLSCKRPRPDGAPGFENSYFAFCYPGYVKLSCFPYSNASSDLHVHLTNQFVQRRLGLYSQVKEATTWLPDELNAYLNRRKRAEVDWCRNRLYGQIRAITGYVAAAFRPHLDSSASPASVFRLYGPDFIIDENLRVWLLEVNTFPSYAKNTAALSDSIRSMWREAVTLATEATLRYRNRQPVEGLASMRNFRMVYSSEDPMLLADLVRQSFP